MSRVFWAELSSAPPLFVKNPSKGRTYAQRKGNRFESQAHARLSDMYPEEYIPAPWIDYKDSSGIGIVQPDGLHFDWERNQLTVVEIKLNHTGDAFYQLRRYAGIVHTLFKKRWSVGILEFTKSFDPWVYCPVEPQLVGGIEEADKFTFPVMVWES